MPLGKRNTFSCRFLTASSVSPTSSSASSSTSVFSAGNIYESLQVSYVVVPKPQQPPIRGSATTNNKQNTTTRLICVARKVNVSAAAIFASSSPSPVTSSPSSASPVSFSGASSNNSNIQLMSYQQQPLLPQTIPTPPPAQKQNLIKNEIINPGFPSAAATPNTTSSKMELFTTKVDPTSFKILQAEIVPHSTSPNALSTTSTSTSSSSLMSNGLLRASMAARTGTMTGKDLLEFCHPDDHDILREHFNRCLRQNGQGGDTSKVYRMRNLISGNTASSGKGILTISY